MITAKNSRKRKSSPEKQTHGNRDPSTKKFSVVGALIGGLLGLLCFFFLKEVPGSSPDAVLSLGLYAGVAAGLFLGGVIGALKDNKVGTT